MKIIAALFLAIFIYAECRAQTNQPTPARPRPVSAPSQQALLTDFYGRLIGRTILVPQTMPNSLPVGMDLQDTNKAIQFFETEFAKRGYVPVRDGEKFVRMMQVGVDDSSNSPFAPMLRLIGPVPATASSGINQSIAPGNISFPQIDLNTFLDFYAKLSGRIVLRPPALPQPTIHFLGQTQLTRAEAIYAFEMVLALNGIAVVHDGENFAQVVSVNEIAKVQTNAPPRKANESRISIAFPSYARLDVLLPVYAKAKGKELQLSNSLGAMEVGVGLTADMTRSEAAYAVETILRYNGYSIVPVDDTKVTVVKNAGK